MTRFGVALLLFFGLVGGVRADEDPVYIFAAASLTDVITAAGEEFERRSATPALGVFASSAALARQIQSGSPADVFISANTAWMDLVEEQGFTIQSSRKIVARNALVIVGAWDRRQQLNAGPATLLNDFPADKRLMLGEPTSVPVGIYAAQALRSLGLYEKLAPNLIFGENTRAVLAWMERGEADFAIVYQTDALTSRKVRVLSRIDVNAHAPIAYPAIVLKGDRTEAAGNFISFLLSESGQLIFRRFGFLAPDLNLDPAPQTP